MMRASKMEELIKLSLEDTVEILETSISFLYSKKYEVGMNDETTELY